jgi:hypothetical protein
LRAISELRCSALSSVRLPRLPASLAIRWPA